MERNNCHKATKKFSLIIKEFWFCLFFMHILSFGSLIFRGVLDHFSWKEVERNKELMINYIVVYI